MFKIVKKEVIDIAEQVEKMSGQIDYKIKNRSSNIDFLTKSIIKIAEH